MPEIIPRYEFRNFAQNFGLVEEKMRKLSQLEKFRESSEIYILSAGNRENNIKIRHDTLDVKVFVKKEKGFQQWSPRMSAEFPLKETVIIDAVFAAFGVAVPELSRPEYNLGQFLEDIILPHPELTLARVYKRRFGYSIYGCISEIAELLINGAAIKTVAVESDNIEAVLKAGGFVWEIDEFLGENQGLIVAEVELESEDQAFPKPDWVGEEVTGDPRYFNSNLIKNPYTKWS